MALNPLYKLIYTASNFLIISILFLLVSNSDPFVLWEHTRATHTRGGRKISGHFALSEDSLNICPISFYSFSKFSLSTSVHFCHLHVSFCISSTNHVVDFLLRYRFTAEIKADLVSYIFPASLCFQFWKYEKSQGMVCVWGGGGEGGGCWGGERWAEISAVRTMGQNNANLKVCISSNVDEAVWEEALSCKRRTVFWLALDANFSVFSLSFLFKITSEKYLAISVRPFGIKRANCFHVNPQKQPA